MQTIIRSAFDATKREYASRVRELNPPKHSIDIGRYPDGTVSSYVNFMSAVLSDGHFGHKTVMVDEKSGKLHGKVDLYEPFGDLISSRSSHAITGLRCGIMAAIAIEKFWNGVRPLNDLKIGMIGAGSINSKTASVIAQLFGTRSFTVKNSERNPGKRLYVSKESGLFSDFGQIVVRDYADFLDCDVIITATSIRPENETLSFDLFNDKKGRLFIAQDMGYFLDPSFRQRIPRFTDDAVQTNAHFKAEFPNDGANLGFLEIEDERFYAGAHRDAAVYLYGICMADLVLLKEMAA